LIQIINLLQHTGKVLKHFPESEKLFFENE